MGNDEIITVIEAEMKTLGEKVAEMEKGFDWVAKYADQLEAVIRDITPGATIDPEALINEAVLQTNEATDE